LTGIHQVVERPLVPIRIYPLSYQQEFLINSLFMIRHLGDDIIQVIPRIHIVCLTDSKQETHYRHFDGCLVITAEEIILSTQSDGAYYIFRQVVKKFK